MATTAQSLLALYGALDQAVTRTGEWQIEAIVERYLPGSTGKNAGWYDQLLGFLASNAHDFAERPEVQVPNLRDALTTLQNRREVTLAGEREGLTTVQLSRMAYALGALSHLPGSYRPSDWPEQSDQEFSRTLEVAGGPPNSGLLDVLRRDFDSRTDWPQVMQFAKQSQLIDGDVAVVPLCQTKLMTVRGHLCVVLTTAFESTTVSLDELKNVIDPLNWAKCLPSFFCSMQPKDKRPDGWSRVLEHVSTTCPIEGTPQMVTALKYWKGQSQGEQLQQPTAWVDYALDDDPLPDANGDGRMVVDEGFIRMTSTADDSASTSPGVRVRTRKVAGFRNLAYVPAAIFACVMGYGDEGVDMLLGGVQKRRRCDGEGWTNWQPSASESARAAATVGVDPTSRAVALAVDMLNECIDDMSEKSAAIAAKWATGAVPIAETMTYTTDLAARLATDPWRYLERLRYPAQGDIK
jgi:hypothetical protein